MSKDVTKFYFCETCGKRISDADIDQGAARDKKLKGVYCNDCAAGVSTMEMMPITDAELAQDNQKTSPGHVRPSMPGKPSGRFDSPPKRSAAHISSSRAPLRKESAVANSGTHSYILKLVAVAGVTTLVTVSGLLLTRKQKTDLPKSADTTTTAASVEKAKSPPAKPEPPANTSKPTPDPIVESNPAPLPVPAKSDGTSPTTMAGVTVSHPGPTPAVETALQAPLPSHPPDATATTNDKKSEPVKASPVAPPPEIVFAPIMSPEQRESLQMLDRVIATLGHGDIAEAVSQAKSGPGPLSTDLISALEKGRRLRQSAVENLNKNPPSAEIKLVWNKIDLSGRLVRIEDNRAWILSQNLEMPVDVGVLPRELLMQALNLNNSNPNAFADKAAFLFSSGDVEQCLVALKRAAPSEAADLRAVLAQREQLKRLKKFEDDIAAVEAVIKSGQERQALSLLEKLKQNYYDLADGQQPRFASLTDSAHNASSIIQIRKLLKGEVLNVDEHLNVEIRYDFVKNPKCIGDFADKDLKVTSEGAHIPLGTFPAAENARLSARFQPTTLHLEYLVQSGHNVFLGHIGNAQFKIRWWGGGEIDLAFEPTYTGLYYRGDGWPHPANSGTYRYTFERTPEVVRFLLDGKEYATKPVPKTATDTNWTTGLGSYEGCDVKEMIVKGCLDPAWLKEQTSHP